MMVYKPIKKPLLTDSGNTHGFVEVSDFYGETTTMSVDRLSNLCEFVEYIKKMGVKKVRIGVMKDSPLFVFIGERNTFAYAISPYLEG